MRRSQMARSNEKCVYTYIRLFNIQLPERASFLVLYLFQMSSAIPRFLPIHANQPTIQHASL